MNTNTNPLRCLKTELKELANFIKIERLEMKRLFQDNKIWEGSIKQSNLFFKSIDYRYLHVVYCELRGIERTKIEIPSENNKIDERRLSTLKNKYILEIQEYENAKTLCVNS